MAYQGVGGTTGKTLEEIIIDQGLPEKETFLNFVWNKKRKAFLGRTCISWVMFHSSSYVRWSLFHKILSGTIVARGIALVKIGIFYIIFYSCLAGWFAGLLHAYYSTLNDKSPKWYGSNSLIQGNPGMGFRPLPRLDSTLIRFHQDQPGSYKPYTDHLEAFLQTYEDVEGQKSCAGRNMSLPDNGCEMDVRSLFDSLGCGRDDDYGFKAGSPCIALKMNKQYDFLPVPYSDLATLEKDQELDFGSNTSQPQISFAPGNVGVSCTGQNDIDKMFLDGHITYSPSTGIPLMYFPYLNQQGYRAPLVVAKFNLPAASKKVVIQVRCHVWAKNIDSSDGKQKRGTTHFELMID